MAREAVVKECAYHHKALEVGRHGEGPSTWDVNPHYERWVWRFVVSCTECEYEHLILGRERHTEPREVSEEEARAIGFRSFFDGEPDSSDSQS